MPASAKFYAKLRDKLRASGDRAEQDHLLDQWLHIRSHATEWDAVQWGFPDDWMRIERAQMAKAEPMKEVRT